MLYAYCIRRAGDPPPDPSLTGVGGMAVWVLEDGRLGIWLSDAKRVETTPQRLREHDRVVRAALRTATPLPIRFGTGFPDEDAARNLLDSRQNEMLAALARVEGKVEMGVTVFWDQHAARTTLLEEQPELRVAAIIPSSGREYLERQKHSRLLSEQLQRRAEALLERVTAAFESQHYPSETRLLPRPGVAGIIAHLVPREEVTGYRRQLEQVRKALPGVKLEVTGPWAPYSFV